MSFTWLGVVLALAVFALASLLASPLTTLLWRRLGALRAGKPAEARARMLFMLRLLPSAFGLLLVVGLLLPAYWRFEPRDTAENVGWGLGLAAGLGALQIACGLLRALRDALHTRRLVSSWLAGSRATWLPGFEGPAHRIESAFPVVSVAGFWRPRLLVARSVLDGCSEEELRAVAAHEMGHLRAGDNLKRLVLRACPDALAWTALGRRIERAWSETAEEAADERAARTLPDAGLALASALVRLARLAPRGRTAVPLSAVLDGGPVARRVERLLAIPPARPLGAQLPLAWLLGLLILALAAVGPLRAVHDLTERLVAGLG